MSFIQSGNILTDNTLTNINEFANYVYRDYTLIITRDKNMMSSILSNSKIHQRVHLNFCKASNCSKRAA